MSATTTTDLERQLAAYDAEFRSAWTELVRRAQTRGAGRLEPVRTGWGGSLIVQRCSYAADTPVEDVLAGVAVPTSIVATEDGRGADVSRWHTAEPTGLESVYVERWSPAGRTWHGYVDPESRLVVQTG